jgi:hypothetical protein
MFQKLGKPLESILNIVLRIRDVYPGSEFFHPGFRVKRFRIRIKEFKFF